MTLSDLVQSPVLPAPVNVESSTSNSFWLSKLHGEEVPMKADTQSGPGLLGNPVFHPVGVRHGSFWRKGHPLTVLHFVEHNVTFKRVGANDVIVIRIAVAPHQTRSLVHCPGHRFEFDGDGTVFEAGAIPNG